MATQEKVKKIVNLSPDFAEVEFVVVDDAIKSRTANYADLDGVKALLEGKVIEVPLDTTTNRLYRFMKKRELRLRKRTINGKLLLWVEPIEVKPNFATVEDQ